MYRGHQLLEQSTNLFSLCITEKLNYGKVRGCYNYCYRKQDHMLHHYAILCIIGGKPRSLTSSNGHTGECKAIGNATENMKIGQKTLENCL